MINKIYNFFKKGIFIIIIYLILDIIFFSLLPEKFTLLELQGIYESILNKSLDKPNFRRKFQKMNLLINCKEKQTNVAHRAATLYRFDINVYEKLREFGFTFEF